MFKFRLQRILELRAEKEKAQARELASARHTAELATQAQDLIAAIRDDSRAQLAQATTATHRVGHLTQLGSVLDSLDTRLSDARDAVVAADETVAKAQSLLEDAARDRRVLDRLKVRHADAHRADEAQKDRVLMDEIALTLFTRKQDTASGDAAAPADSPDGSAR
jgi:flagellar protein FliJ